MRKRWIWVILGVAVLSVAVLAVATREREPEYGGKKLSEWAKMYVDGLDDLPNGSNQTRQAAEAIREIGTTSVPYLAKWKAYAPPGWQTAAEQRLSRIPQAFNAHSHIHFHDEKLRRARYAFYALIALDNETRGTNHQINQVMIDEQARLSGSANIPMFMNVLAHTNRSARAAITFAYVIGLFGTNGSGAVPELERLLTDSNFEVRRVATNALRRIRNDTNFTNMNK